MENKDRKIFCCKRIRMMNYLRDRGWIPDKVVVEYNGKYYNWLYYTKDKPKLQEDIDAWFEQAAQRK